MRRRSLARLASLISVLSLGARAATAGPDPEKKGPTTFTWLDSGFLSMDPAKAGTPLEERLALACFEPLTRIDSATGKVVPAAAESWTESPDGKTWTFKLRPTAHWIHKMGDTWEERSVVSAEDFVWSWKRLLDPETKSPNAAILDAIPGCRAYRADGARGSNIDAITAALLALAGDGKRSVSGADVVGFLDTSETQPRWWLSSCDAPAIQKLLAWSAKDP